MAYIGSDGKVHQGERPSNNPISLILNSFSKQTSRTKIVLIIILAVGLKYFCYPDPLANGKIPASDVSPNDHWNRIQSDDTFMRRLTEHLDRKNRNIRLEHELKEKSGKIEIVLDRVDFGGFNGHRAELSSGVWDGDIEKMRGTRCSTAQSAITAYFCGADVATNQDVALDPVLRKPHNFGIRSFSTYVKCRHEQGRREDEGENNVESHRRAVYRLGVGAEDSLSGYSHAFSIIAQPDGTFFWLQSFISQYSLQRWMSKTRSHPDGTTTPIGHMTLEELLERLDKLERLMNIRGWTTQANSDYDELFDVDKEKEAIKRGKPPVSTTWEPTHRLAHFYWDEACEYPLPPTTIPQVPSQSQDDSDKTIDNVKDYQFEISPPSNKSSGTEKAVPDKGRYDECSLRLGKTLLEELTKKLR